MAASVATFKIAVVGPSSVGKSALIQFLVQQKFIPGISNLCSQSWFFLFLHRLRPSFRRNVWFPDQTLILRLDIIQ